MHFRFLELPNEIQDIIIDQYIIEGGIKYDCHGSRAAKQTVLGVVVEKPLCLYDVSKAVRIKFKARVQSLKTSTELIYHINLITPSFGGCTSALAYGLPTDEIEHTVIHIGLDTGMSDAVAPCYGFGDQIRISAVHPDRLGLDAAVLVFRNLKTLRIVFNGSNTARHYDESWGWIALFERLHGMLKCDKGTSPRLPHLQRLLIVVNDIVKVDRFKTMTGDNWMWRKTMKADDSTSIELFDRNWTKWVSDG